MSRAHKTLCFHMLYNEMKKKISPKNLGYMGSTPGNRNSNTWFTPPEWIDRCRKVMGTIDLDPFSSSDANKIVQATQFFTEDDDALVQTWTGPNVFMNPPYGVGIFKSACLKFLEQWHLKHFEQAIVLINNCTETISFQAIAKECSAMCLVNKRIVFYSTDGKPSVGNTRGQVFIYYGLNVGKFKEEFEDAGIILSPV